VIGLPAKAPTPEEWAEDVAALRQRVNGAAGQAGQG
jgi:hypothetical protein